MTHKQIIESFHGLKTKRDLLNLLNALKQEDLGKDCHLFTMKQIKFYCNPNNKPKHRYKDFTIPKKSGGVRTISAPRGSLKSILTYLNVIFQAMYEPTDAAMGFVPGRSVVDNARVHTGRKYVFNTDLKDFFPSVHQARIWKMLQLKPFSLNVELASIIAGLCCMKDPSGTLDKNGKVIGVLPQGSPCSPILTNIVCRNLDKRLLGLAKRFNLKYTRYADDITFSGDYNVFQVESEFMKEFKRIVEDQQFDINDKKTRLQKEGQRQEVTGLLVNKKVNLAKEYSRDLRSLLYIWKQYGKDQAYAKFIIRYKSSKSYRPKKQSMPKMEAVIIGKLLYMKMVMGESSATYKSLRDKFIALCPDKVSALRSNFTYLSSYSLDEFESLYETKVDFAYKPEGSAKGKSKTMGTFSLVDEKHFVSVNIRCDKAVDSYLAAPTEEALIKLKKRLYISLTERGNDRFWLITRAPMTNEHTRSYRDAFKPKVRSSQSLDHILTSLVESEFDLKTLEEWDKIKMS